MYHWPLILLLLTACTMAEQDLSPQYPPEQTKSIRYLALGDSYTIGQSVVENQRWPVQLADLLRTRKYEPSLRLIARTGWTSTELADAMQADLSPSDTFELVSLLIGVNDQFQGLSLASYKKEFAALLQSATRLAAGRKERVFIVSIPDYGFTPYGKTRQAQISQGIDLFNAAAREIAKGQGIAFYEITDISRQGLEEPQLVATDGLHPSGLQYQRWVERFGEKILLQLQE